MTVDTDNTTSTIVPSFVPTALLYTVSLYEVYILSGAHKRRSVQLRGTAFESDRL